MITFHQHRKRWITVPVPTTQHSLNRAVDELRDESLTYESENRPLTQNSAQGILDLRWIHGYEANSHSGMTYPTLV